MGPSQITKKGRGAPQITSATRKRGGQGGFWAQPPLGFSGFLGSMAEIFQRPRGGGVSSIFNQEDILRRPSSCRWGRRVACNLASVCLLFHFYRAVGEA